MTAGEVFEVAVERTLWLETGGDLEGGAPTDDPRDPGGYTRWGIAARYHPEVLLGSFDLDAAIAIYRREYWARFELWRLAEELPLVAAALFDLVVNPGPGGGVKVAQRAVNWIRLPRELFLAADGKLGPKTRAALRRAGRRNEADLLAAFAAFRVRYYVQVSEKRPQSRAFARGWLRRSFQDFLLVWPAGHPVERFYAPRGGPVL